MTVSAKAQSLRDFVDALRGALGKAPLYRDDTCRDTMEERFASVTHSLPEPFDWKDWFQPKAQAPTTRSAFRDLSIGMAMKRKALRFEAKERKRA